MSSSPKKWRTSDGEQQHKMKTVDNIYNLKYDYDTAVLLYPSILTLLTRSDFYEHQAKYNDSKK